MTKFKVGDRVRRINFNNGSHPDSMKIGDTGFITHIYTSHGINMANIKGYHSDSNLNNLELVEETKKSSRPWLKITPPVPEIRKLQKCLIHEYMGIMPWQSKVRIYLDDGCGEFIGPPMNKDELQKFGVTLIEISEEMK